jgi:hypothetical protein
MFQARNERLAPRQSEEPAAPRSKNEVSDTNLFSAMGIKVNKGN